MSSCWKSVQQQPGMEWGGLRLLLTCLFAAVASAGPFISEFTLDASEMQGWSTDGSIYNSLGEAWKELQDFQGGFTSFTQRSHTFWAGQEASYTGVLLGYDSLHAADIDDSRDFLIKSFEFYGKDHLKQNGHRYVVADCGAGVGRVSKNVLLPFFKSVDIQEPVHHMIQKAREDLGHSGPIPGVPAGHRVENFFLDSLQSWEPGTYRYNAYWIQWCLLYLPDAELMELFDKLRFGLIKNGIIFIKENVASRGFVVDKKDMSFTRSRALFEQMFNNAGFVILHHGVQKNFPPDVYEVHMWALVKRPAICLLDENEILEENRRREDAAYLSGQATAQTPGRIGRRHQTASSSDQNDFQEEYEL